jgi:hypothetical protein
VPPIMHPRKWSVYCERSAKSGAAQSEFSDILHLSGDPTCISLCQCQKTSAGLFMLENKSAKMGHMDTAGPSCLRLGVGHWTQVNIRFQEYEVVSRFLCPRVTKQVILPQRNSRFLSTPFQVPASKYRLSLVQVVVWVPCGCAHACSRNMNGNELGACTEIIV